MDGQWQPLLVPLPVVRTIIVLLPWRAARSPWHHHRGEEADRCVVLPTVQKVEGVVEGEGEGVVEGEGSSCKKETTMHCPVQVVAATSAPPKAGSAPPKCSMAGTARPRGAKINL